MDILCLYLVSNWSAKLQKIFDILNYIPYFCNENKMRYETPIIIFFIICCTDTYIKFTVYENNDLQRREFVRHTT